MSKSKSVFEKYPFDPRMIPGETQEIAVVSGSWRDMGRQYAQQCREGFLARAADLKGAYLDFYGNRAAIEEMAHRYTRAADKEFPQLIELFEGMAEGAGVTLTEAIIVFYGKSMMRAEQECSHVAAWGEATDNGHLLGAGNMDLEYDAREYLPAVLAFPEDGNAFIASELFHRACLNEKGLLLQGSGGQNAGENDLIRPDGQDLRHMWNDVNLYAIAYCSTAAEAVEAYQRWKYVAGCNQFFGDKSHDCYMMEFTASRCAVRRAGDYGERSYLIQNNGYIAEEMQGSLMTHERYWTDCLPRYWTVQKVVEDHWGGITLDILNKAQGSYRYYIPEGWSFAYREDWGVNYWYNDDREPFPSGWHEDWDPAHMVWSTQSKSISFKAVVRHLVDVDTLTCYLMKGESDPVLSCNPGTLGTYWNIRLGGGPLDIVKRARKELEYQLWRAARDIIRGDASREKAEPHLNKAKACMYEGINCQALAVCSTELDNPDETMMLYGRALTAFCKGQCHARLAQKDPGAIETD